MSATSPGGETAIRTTAAAPVAPASKIERAHNLFFEAVSKADKSPQDAIRMLREALRLEPQFASAHEKLASLLLDQYDYGEARRHASSCLSLDPKNMGCHHIEIHAIEVEEGMESAFPAIQECLAIQPKNGTCLAEAQTYYVLRDERDKAEAVLTEAFAGVTEPAERELELAAYFAHVQDKAREREAYTHACDLGSTDACEWLKLQRENPAQTESPAQAASPAPTEDPKSR